MPGGRGTFTEVTEEFLEQVDTINQQDLPLPLQIAAVEGLGRIVAASISPNYEINWDENYKKKK